MKRIICLACTVLMLCSMATIALAGEITVTTEVPETTYTLSIPESTELPYASQMVDIGNVTVTSSTGFPQGKNLEVTVTYTNLVNSENSKEIPFNLEFVTNYGANEFPSGSVIYWSGSTSGTLPKGNGSHFYINSVCSISGLRGLVTKSAWLDAEPGTYTATITFNAQVVTETD